jgi:hypothetical protein
MSRAPAKRQEAVQVDLDKKAITGSKMPTSQLTGALVVIF